jgi:hypothetical protein
MPPCGVNWQSELLFGRPIHKAVCKGEPWCLLLGSPDDDESGWSGKKLSSNPLSPHARIA